MLRESLLQITNFHYYHNGCWHVSSTESAVAPSNAAWGCLKKAFHPRSRMENSNQRVIGLQMGSSLYTMGSRCQKSQQIIRVRLLKRSTVDITIHKTSFLTSRMSTLLPLLPFTSPVRSLFSRKGWHRKTKSQSDSDDCDNEANMNAVTLKMWFHQMTFYCCESRKSGIWHTENLEGHWAIFQGQTATQQSNLHQTDMQ